VKDNILAPLTLCTVKQTKTVFRGILLPVLVVFSLLFSLLYVKHVSEATMSLHICKKDVNVQGKKERKIVVAHVNVSRHEQRY
jgi:hypothetical protein